MAEEPGAGGHSSDDDPDEAAGGDEEPPVDGGESADREGGSVDSEVEPQVESEIGDDSTDDADGEDEDATGDAADHTPGFDDEAQPLGAVTDASSPPAESAPGVGESGADADESSADADESGSGGDADGEGGADESGSGDAEVVEEDIVDPPPEGGVGGSTQGDAAGSDPAGDEETAEYGPAAEADDAVEPTTAPPPGPAPATDAEGAVEQPPEGPPDDEEMPLADHIEEMVLRLAVVCAVAAVVAGTVFFFEPLAEDTILFIWQSVIPHHELKVHPLVGGTTYPGHYIEVNAVGSTNPRVYGPLELKLTELKFASLVGFVLALPVFVYETYRFMRPGLYPNERRYYLAAVPTSLVLAFVGVAFSYFIILPAIFAYFVRYSERAGVLAFALRQTFDLILVLMGYMALVFQIPLFIMLAIMMGLTDRLWLEARRLYFWGGFLGVSFLFVPEPTGMAPILVALTMVGLFEGTLALLRWTGN